LREGIDRLPRDALDVGEPVADRLPLHSQPPTQLPAELRLVEVAERLRWAEQLRGVEAKPTASIVSGRVHHQGVGVEEGIAGARDPVAEERDDQAIALHLLPHSIDRPSGADEVPLGVVERRLHRGVVGSDHLLPR
jgi:hypothetical protein